MWLDCRRWSGQRKTKERVIRVVKNLNQSNLEHCPNKKLEDVFSSKILLAIK